MMEQKVSYMDNGFGRFTDDDKVIYNKSPKWTGGLNNSFTYKDWNFQLLYIFPLWKYLLWTIPNNRPSS